MTAPMPACRCCGSAHVSLQGRKPGRFIKRDFEFYRCADCGFMFVEPFSGFAIYDDAYYRGHGPDPYVDYESEYRDWRRTDRLMEFKDLARIAADFLRRRETSQATREPFTSRDAPLRWLDFGCGAGALLKYLRERNRLDGRSLELTGHDVGSYAELLRRQDRFRILNLEELSAEPDERYDVISMIEVLEHLPDPRGPLALVGRLLKPGGLLLLTTGNLSSWMARRQGIHYRYCAPEIHVSLFNPHCLSQLYRRVGLEPLPVRYAGAVKFKVVKSLRRRPALRSLAHAALRFPPFVRLVDAVYGVSDMPCAVKPPLKV